MKDDLELKTHNFIQEHHLENEEVVCDACESDNIKFELQELTFDYGVAPAVVRLKVAVPVKVCGECGIMTTCTVAEDIKQKAIEEHLHPKSPEEIKEIRVKTGLNRKAFALATGIGEASLGRWESGANKPNQAFDLYLELISRRENMEFLLNRFQSGGVAANEEQQPKFRKISPENDAALMKRARDFSLHGACA